jgi:hypothetical protein
MTERKRLEAFIEGLTELTKKYGLSIGGCGCCGSPWIRDLQNDDMPYENLEFDEERETYTYEEG